MKTVPVNEFKFPNWEDVGSEHFDLTCKNHTFLRWSTKHPGYRNIHYLGLENYGEGATKEQLQYAFKECDCKYEDLVVITKEA